MIDWDKVTKEEHEIIMKISQRFCEIVGDNTIYQEIAMDVSAVHINNPLRLNDLLCSDDFNFMHDVGGINRHIDRETGDLTNCFLPRFSC